MTEERTRPSTTSALHEVAPTRKPRPMPAWRIALGGVVAGMLLMATMVATTDLLRRDTAPSADVEAAYIRGLYAGDDRAGAVLAESLTEADAEGYARGRLDAWRALNARSAWKEPCPSPLLVLNGISGCAIAEPVS